MEKDFFPDFLRRAMKPPYWTTLYNKWQRWTGSPCYKFKTIICNLRWYVHLSLAFPYNIHKSGTLKKLCEILKSDPVLVNLLPETPEIFFLEHQHWELLLIFFWPERFYPCNRCRICTLEGTRRNIIFSFTSTSTVRNYLWIPSSLAIATMSFIC